MQSTLPYKQSHKHYYNYLDGLVELVLELERFEVVHVALAVEEVLLERGPGPLLVVPGLLGVRLVKAVAVVVGVLLPLAQADPAEVVLQWNNEFKTLFY